MRIQVVTLKEQSHYLEATKAQLTEKNLSVWYGEVLIAEFAREAIAGWKIAPGEDITQVSRHNGVINGVKEIYSGEGEVPIQTHILNSDGAIPSPATKTEIIVCGAI